MTRQEDNAKLIKDMISGTFISSMIILVTLVVPELGFVMAMILPMPLLYYRLKLGRTPGVIIASAILVITAATTGGLSVDMLFYGAVLLIGLFLGEFLEMQFSVEKTIFYTVISTVSICSTFLFIYAGSTGSGLLELITAYVAAILKLTMTLYEDMGMPQENIELIRQSMDIIQYVMVRLIPSMIIIMLTFITWVNTLSIKRILIRKGIVLKELEKLNHWKAPEKLVWVVILSGAALMIPGKGNKILALNSILMLMPVYFFQGIAVISFIFEKKKFPPMLRLFIYSIIAIQQLFILLVVGLGFFDTWVNFRKIDIFSEPE